MRDNAALTEERHLCWWCKMPIDRTKQPSVQQKVPLSNGQPHIYHYHAKACWPAFRSFLTLHEFQGLDPVLHDHE